MNIDSLLRGLSGPRPLHRAVDIVSKPHIWHGNTAADSLETSQLPKLPGPGRTAIQSTSTPSSVDTTSMPGTSVASAYAIRGAPDAEELISGGGTLLRRICIFLYSLMYG